MGKQSAGAKGPGRALFPMIGPMFELAREQLLWLFAFVGVFFLVYLFARRYRRVRVTYGFIWERVAGRVRPPAFKRLLRTLLTVLISLAMLGGIILYAAGLSPPKEEQPAPLLVFIVLDGTVSMRATTQGKTRRELAHARAAEIISRLAEDDRALLVQFRGGTATAGRWLRRADAIDVLAPTDFKQPDLASLREIFTSPVPSDIPAAPAPVRLALWLGDAVPPLANGSPPPRIAGLAAADRWLELHGVACLFESFGQAAVNDGVVDVSWRTSRTDGSARLSARLASGRAPRWRVEDDQGSVLARRESPDFEIGDDLPPVLRVTVETHGPDALPEDDSVSLWLSRFAVRKVILCHPASESVNALLVDSLKLLLPGREITVMPIADLFPRPVEADLVVLDRVAPQTVKAPMLLAFCALPPGAGSVAGRTRAAAGLYRPVAVTDDFSVPDPSLISAREAVPLASSANLSPLITHVQAGVLVARGQVGESDVLYVGFSPHESGFLFVPAGPLLLQRWLGVSRGRPVLPPCLKFDGSAEVRLSQASTLKLELAQGWPDAQGSRSFEITSGPDGRLSLGPFEQPGVYRVSGGAQGEVTGFYADEREQAGTFTPTKPLELAGLKAPIRERDWRDVLCGALLWIALFTLVLEWTFWLAGVTE